MKIEDRLHDALHEYADGIEPDPGAWSQIAARFDEPTPAPRRPARRPLVLAGVAVTIVAVLIAGLLVRDGDDDGDHRIATSPTSGAPTGDQPPAPSRILAITTAGQPVMYESGTLRELLEYPTGGMAEGTQIAVAPNGSDAYVVKGDGNEGCADHSIQRLAIGGALSAGEPVATNATDPAVSPDGRYLAYLHCSPEAGNRADHIVLRDLTTGEEQVTTAPPGTFFIQRVEFAGDAHRAVFNLFDDATGRATLHELDLVNGEAPPGRDVGAGAGQAVWMGLRGVTGDYLAVSAAAAPAAVVSQTPPGVVPVRNDVLFTLPGIPTQVASDRSGLHILAVVDHALYEWNVGDPTATKVFDGGISGAVWVPDSLTQPTTSRLPAGVVVARNGALDVLGADGDRHSTLGTVDDVTRISAVGDSRDLIYSFTGPSPACGGGAGPTINRLDTTQVQVDPPTALYPQTVGSGAATDTFGPSTFVVGGSASPAVSPDGKWVAYGIACDGIELGFTSLRTGRNYRIDARPSTPGGVFPALIAVEPLAWAPDSQHLLYRLTVEGDATPRYYLGRVTPSGADVDPVAIEVGQPITAAALLGADSLAVAQNAEGGSVIRQMSLSQPGVRDILFEATQPITALIADPSGEHLLALTTSGALYRWSVGDERPTKLSDGVTAAVWTAWS